MLATLTGGSASLRARGEAQGPWLPVTLGTREVRVDGWVLAGRVREELSLWTKGRGSGGWSASDVDFVEVPAGASIYREGGGEPIARALADTRVILVHDGSPVAISFNTRWGWLTGELRCAAHLPPNDAGARFRCG